VTIGKVPVLDVSSLPDSALEVLRELRRENPMTLTEIGRSRDLSRPTVAAALRQLDLQGWITQHEPSAADGQLGRPATRYGFNRSAGYVLGLDIGGHRVSAGLADLSGSLLATEHALVPGSANAERRLAVAFESADAVLAAAQVERTQLLAAAAGTVGVIDDHGRVTLSTVIPGWTGLDLSGRLHAFLECPVRVESDASLAALAERALGSAVGVDHLVYVHVGQRIGSGIVINGRIHRGFTGASGEIGALRAIGWADAPTYLAASTDDDAVDVERVVQDTLSGQPATMRAVREFGKAIAPGIAALALTLDPQQIVVGGGLSRIGAPLTDAITEQLAEICLRVPKVTSSTLGADGVILGAVQYAMEWVDDQILFLNGR
jgi:predicted NBD/HSP70 family sugar kinase